MGEHAVTNSDRSLESYLKQFGRRIRLGDSWLFAQRWLWAGLAGVLTISLVGRVIPIQGLWWWALSPLVVWALAVLVYGLFVGRSLFLVAWRVDAVLGLKERLSSALALRQKAASIFAPELVQRQYEDALVTCRAVEPQKAFPFRWLRRSLWLAVLLSLGVVAATLLPNPMDAVLAERAAVAQTAEDQANKLDQLAEEIAEDASLSPEDREQLLRELAALAEQLRENPGDRAEALADLSRVEEALRQRENPQVGQSRAALEALASQLQSLAKGDAQDASTAADMEEALEQLAELLQNQDESGREQLAQSLAQAAAQAAQAGEASLAQALASLSQSAQTGDQTAIAQASEGVQGAFEGAQEAQALQDALQQALAQMQNSSQALAQAGAPMAQSGTQGQPGTGQGQSNQAGSGGGTTADTLPPATRTGAAGDPEGMGPSSELELFESRVYVPFDQGGGENVLNIPGIDTGEGETQVREVIDPQTGASRPALIPYQEVYGAYVQAANQAVEQSVIPASLKDYIKAYFSELEP